jgi:hypothetical protein
MYATAYPTFTTMRIYNQVKKGIYNSVREYINSKGGSIKPTTEDNKVDLFYFGKTETQEVIGMEVDEDGIVRVITNSADGVRDSDSLMHFSNEEMLKIIEIFKERD